MDVEIELGRGWWLALAPVALLAFFGIALLGRSVTPQGGGLLTPVEWQLVKAERAYIQELTSLRDEAENLVALLNQAPDPVRAGAAAERIAQDTLDGQPSLELQRAALVQAAEGVRLWAMGGGDRQTAEEALSEVIRLLEGAP